MGTSFEKKAQDLAKKFGIREDEFLKSGSVIFDSIMGKGIPLGKFIQISSESGLGKSSSVLHFCRVACALGKKVAFLDFEKGVNDSQLKGMKLMDYKDKQFFLYQPTTFEDAEEIIDSLADDPDLVYIVIDSITSMLPGKLENESISDVQPGLHARYAALFLSKYKSVAIHTNTTFIFINQMRVKLNFRGMSTRQAAGGNAQKFYMDVRIEMSLNRKLEKVTDTIEGKKTVPYGADVNVWAEKNRYARPFIEGVITIYYGRGISNIAAYSRWLVANDIVTQTGGGWFVIKWNDQEEKVRGQVKLQEWIKQHTKEIKEFIYSHGGFLLVKEEDSDSL